LSKPRATVQDRQTGTPDKYLIQTTLAQFQFDRMKR